MCSLSTAPCYRIVDRIASGIFADAETISLLCALIITPARKRARYGVGRLPAADAPLHARRQLRTPSTARARAGNDEGVMSWQ
ncbi:MAG TPA: hypothetical protein VE178_03045, partial [Silvibacterium sp.]|nr:hypothetical protein [Silvibacterium sp.]